MWIDGRANANARTIRSDVCLIGAGAAGIALGLRLAGKGAKVVVVESGGFELDSKTQALYDGEVVDDDYPSLISSRLRFVGGTTNHWGGACNPITPFEFRSHDWLPHSGWPITRSDVEPYEAAARTFLGLPDRSFEFDPSEVGGTDQAALLQAPGGAHSSFDTVLWRRTHPDPTRLRTTQREALETAPNLRCIGHTNITELVPDRDRTKVVRAMGSTLEGRRYIFEARDFVLCAGAIENARLLLLSDRKSPGGLGNVHDQVGRYFADHGGVDLGGIHLFHSAPPIREETFARAKEPSPTQRWNDIVGFAASDATREREHLLGFAAMCFPSTVMRTPDGIQSLDKSEGTSAADSSPRVLRMLGVFEKAPNPESRVSLGEEKDALGLRKVKLDLNVQPIDRKSIAAHAKRLAHEVARSGNGRIRFNDFERMPWTTLAGHHAGTTRMADDPKRGVTDRNGRVHGLANLFVTGGALFPTVGWQNPTFTIVALALRLAEHLTNQGER